MAPAAFAVVDAERPGPNGLRGVQVVHMDTSLWALTRGSKTAADELPGMRNTPDGAPCGSVLSGSLADGWDVGFGYHGVVTRLSRVKLRKLDSSSHMGSTASFTGHSQFLHNLLIFLRNRDGALGASSRKLHHNDTKEAGKT
ncbi:hypothetical protein EYF80_015182 [Liparis tanakae]|uniref:Uncharacterized protein n=1 Tax=Liparis tanakae TaxID=230148 RepID=A0A4Z2IB29_9TELE|nr:hypothetical protein EYF80_015182 [Liparis tanakae]